MPRCLPYGTGSVSLQTGTLEMSVPLDFRQSTPSGLDAWNVPVPPALVNTSDTVNVKPILETTFATDSGSSKTRKGGKSSPDKGSLKNDSRSLPLREIGPT